jgi:integrase
MQEGPEPLYDLQQLAVIAPFNERQLRRYIESGRLVAGKLGEGRSAKWVVRAGTGRRSWRRASGPRVSSRTRESNRPVLERRPRPHAGLFAAREPRSAPAARRRRWGARRALGHASGLQARALLPLPRTRPHSLGRTYISIALPANKFDVKWVMSQVGHSDSNPERKGTEAGARPSVDQMISSAARSESPT